MFELTYTSTLSELQQYLDGKLKEYIKEKALSEEEECIVKSHYEDERRILAEQVYESPEILRDLCFMAFLGYACKEKQLKVSNTVIQCPFIMYLLGVASFDLFDEGYDDAEYLLKRRKINTTDYSYVDDEFYKSMKKDISDFLGQSSYVAVWIGYAEHCDAHTIDREPTGIFVAPCETDILEQKSMLGLLYDGTECILEEQSFGLYEQGIAYRFYPMKYTRKDLSDEEFWAIKSYKKGELDKQTTMQMLASEMIASGYEDCFDYYETMKNLGDNVFSREDLFCYLLERRMEEEKAWYWTEIIRKGTLAWKLRKHLIAYQDYTELYLAIGKERIELFCQVHYMPSCWNVLEAFYRLTEDKGI